MMKPCLFLLAAVCCGTLAAGDTPEPPAPPRDKLILRPDITEPEVTGHVMPHHLPAVLNTAFPSAIRPGLPGAVPAGDLVLFPKGGRGASMLIRSGSIVICNDPPNGTTFNSTDGKPGIPMFLHNAGGKVLGPAAISPGAGSPNSAMPKNPADSSKPVSRRASPIPDSSSRRTFSNMPVKPFRAPAPGSSPGAKPFRAPSPYIK